MSGVNGPKSPPEPVNTDPRYIYADDSNVIAYRLGIVESDIANMAHSINTKLDRIVNEYPTHQMLALVLEPMKTKLSELENERKQEIADKAKNQQSYKIALFSAIASPIFTIIVVVVMANALGLKA